MFLIALFVTVAVADKLPGYYEEPIAIVRSASVADPETGKYSYRSVPTSNN